jgi:hypothetical protein
VIVGKLDGKVAVITGGSTSMALACAATGRAREVGNMVVLPASASLVQR